MQIQISWHLKKPTDLDLHCLQRQGISGFSGTRVFWNSPFDYLLTYLTLVLLVTNISCLCKQFTSRLVGFWSSQLIWICTVCFWVCEFILTIRIKLSDWLKIRNGCGILIYSAWQGLKPAGWVANTANPDQMVHSAASDMGLHCLLRLSVWIDMINMIYIYYLQ